MKGPALGYLLLACAAILIVIAFTGGAHVWIDVGVAIVLAAAGVTTLVRARR